MPRLPGDRDPIAAIATAPGRGGIGVIRVSSPEPLTPLIQALLGRPLQTRHAHFLPFLDADGEAIDEGLALHFVAPHSYTGEHVLELQGHGGPMVLRRLLERVLEAGREQHLRLAQAGEFTRRAFLNDRLDLAQAEAVADLIDASTQAAARSAMRSLTGVFSQRVQELADSLLELRMLVEATLDFPEEEIEFLEKYQAGQRLARIREKLDALRREARQGVILRDGLRVVLAGEPNVGKSSLLNALAGEEVAIVTPIAGTTRDRVVQQIAIEGVPLHIIDTAGLRETQDEVERIGIERTWQEITRADLVLHLVDAREPDTPIAGQIAQRLPAGVPVLKVLNKVDLCTQPVQGMAVSALQGTGLDKLRHELLQQAGWQPAQESPYLARERHVQALAACDAHLESAAAHAACGDQVLDLFAEELRLAHDALGEITGRVHSDDLLGVIFGRFCIGK
jgi:tRNA modification GTPase